MNAPVITAFWPACRDPLSASTPAPMHQTSPFIPWAVRNHPVLLHFLAGLAGALSKSMDFSNPADPKFQGVYGGTQGPLAGQYT